MPGPGNHFEPKGNADVIQVKAVRLNAESKRGLTQILRVLTDDFDNAFDRLFPDATDKQIMEICAAMEWLEQHAYDIYE